MTRHRSYTSKMKIRQAARRNSSATAKSSHLTRKINPRNHLGVRDMNAPFAPPEDWHEPREELTESDDFSIVHQDAGEGYRHILTDSQIRDRLADLPAEMVEPLDVVQLSRMTRKKQSFLCYGMQWGTTIYLYPLEDSLVETFYTPPRPALYNESKMYGGIWRKYSDNVWTLTWSEKAIRDFYLNNILIHELGHLLDDRNSSYQDRERYAEWFAIEHGYRATGGRNTRHKTKSVRRRHHAV